MNENLNLVEILKNCPKGTKLYSTIFGEVKFMSIKENTSYPIIVKVNNKNFESFTADGRMYDKFDGECVLFPSKDQRDWSKFKIKKPKFDPKTLNAFDRVLARTNDFGCGMWYADLFSHLANDGYKVSILIGLGRNTKVIPYNEETKHLLGTTDEAPEYYRYWED